MMLDPVARAPVTRALPLLLLASLALLAAVAHGCSSTDIGNPDNQQHYARVQTSFVAESEARSGALLLDDALDLEEAWINVDSLRFDSGEACSRSDVLQPEPTVVTELVSGTEHPAAPTLSLLLPARVCRVTVGLGPADATALPSGAPADLVDRSIVLLARRADGVPLLLRDDATLALTLTPVDPQGFELVEGDQAFIVGFAPQTWLDLTVVNGLLDDLLGGLLGGILGDDDLLIIDDVTNSDVLASFLSSFATSAVLYRDLDADGVLDPDERSPIATSAAPP